MQAHKEIIHRLTECCLTISINYVKAFVSKTFHLRTRFAKFSGSPASTIALIRSSTTKKAHSSDSECINNGILFLQHHNCNIVSPFNRNICYNRRQMKILSVILIIAYLMLPVLCFGHPCELIVSDVEQSAVVSNDSAECPFNHDTDNCETTCCCAGHVHVSSFSKIPYNELTTKLLPCESHLSLPQILDRIFVPPQNNS